MSGLFFRLNSHVYRLIHIAKYSSTPCMKSKIESSHVLISNIYDITTIGINNISKKNCLSTKVIQQLKNAFEEFNNSDSPIAILHGESGTFCSGFDIKEIVEYGYNHLDEQIQDWKRGFLCKKPIICALNGYAVAEGFELALACDLRVIEDTASMGFLGRRFGVPLSFFTVERLSRLIGQSRALDLIYTGRKISGIDANEWGLAARNVSTGTAFGQATALALSISKYPQQSILYDRLNILREQNENKILQSNLEKDVAVLKQNSIKEAEENLPNFFKGIGKHGKSRNIKKKQIPSWDSMEEEKPFSV